MSTKAPDAFHSCTGADINYDSSFQLRVDGSVMESFGFRVSTSPCTLVRMSVLLQLSMGKEVYI